jgi:hypothetical protein
MKPSRLFLFVMALTVVSMVLASCAVPPAAPAQPAAPAEPAAEQPAAAVPAAWKGRRRQRPDLKGRNWSSTMCQADRH